MAPRKAGELRLPRNNPSYDIDAPIRSVLAPMMDRLAELSPAPEPYILKAGTIPGGSLTSYIVKTQTKETRSEERAEREIRERQLAWLERLGGCTRKDGQVYAGADTIMIPGVDSERILRDSPVAYTAGQSKRRNAERDARQELIGAWDEVLFQGKTSRKIGDTVWTRSKILEAIDEARGEIDENAVLLLASSMSRIGYDAAYPLLVWVNKKGERYTVDGRHRAAAALERELEPVEVHRSYSGVEEMLAAIVRADETRRGFDPVTAADRWAAIGIDLGTLRVLAGTDQGSAERARAQRAFERAGRREREKTGKSRPVGRPSTTNASDVAQGIVAREQAGEAINIAAEAKANGLSRTTLSDAVRRERRKPDMSDYRQPPPPTVLEPVVERPPLEPEPPAPAVLTHTCTVCGIAGPASARGLWGDVRRGTFVSEQGHASHTIHDHLPSLAKVHLSCFKKLNDVEREKVAE